MFCCQRFWLPSLSTLSLVSCWFHPQRWPKTLTNVIRHGCRHKRAGGGPGFVSGAAGGGDLRLRVARDQRVQGAGSGLGYACGPVRITAFGPSGVICIAAL